MDATNLVAGDTNGRTDVFVRDRSTGKTTRESKGQSGVQGNSISSVASISQDGRFVVFESWASNLVPNDNNGTKDIFVRDRKMGTTTRVSVHCISGGICIGGNGYSERASISADGRFIAFESLATNLVSGDTNGKQDLFVFDRQTGTTTRESMGPLGIQANDDSAQARLSADGRFVALLLGRHRLDSGRHQRPARTRSSATARREPPRW